MSTFKLRDALAARDGLGRSGEFGRFVRYLFIGGGAVIIDLGLFFLLFNIVAAPAWTSQVVAVGAAILFSFFVNARHNFGVSDRMAARFATFAAVCAFGGALGYGVIASGLALGVDANLGKLASLPVVFAAQYLLNSRITFRQTA